MSMNKESKETKLTGGLKAPGGVMCLKLHDDLDLAGFDGSWLCDAWNAALLDGAHTAPLRRIWAAPELRRTFLRDTDVGVEDVCDDGMESGSAGARAGAVLGYGAEHDPTAACLPLGEAGNALHLVP
ncbi:hypothetical protein B0J13DRAFT_519977 [Dactylonectria estremocensis]|uniref:Uncharacterized protein n=1 Tax=Dactylonectria estremocensis TaxID=1079267 RepID=A0A9P9FGK3_9HYPO|nr:hypothetical protein B0J13DRAFT_519977 [Dactylonectria estremocensis]